ncbi:MAG: hypothetical protein RR318_07000 [Alistipes sp.]
MQKIVQAMNATGIPADCISINKPFNEFLTTVHDKDYILVNSLNFLNGITELMTTTKALAMRNIRLESLTEKWYNNSPEIITTLQGICDLITQIRTNRSQISLAKAKAAGKKLGRPVGTVKIANKVTAVNKLRQESGFSVVKACAAVGCNPRSYYRHIHKKI